MSNLTEANFALKKFKVLKAGVTVQWEETIVIGDDLVTKADAYKKMKDDPHKDAISALQALKEVVAYDEGYGNDVDFNITGVTVFPSAEVAIISHTKVIESGATNRNSGRIHRSSEEFELSERLFELIGKIEHEAYQYAIKNKRMQLSLAFTAEEEAA